MIRPAATLMTLKQALAHRLPGMRFGVGALPGAQPELQREVDSEVRDAYLCKLPKREDPAASLEALRNAYHEAVMPDDPEQAKRFFQREVAHAAKVLGIPRDWVPGPNQELDESNRSAGQYNRETHTVDGNFKAVLPMLRLIETAAHETYHAARNLFRGIHSNMADRYRMAFDILHGRFRRGEKQLVLCENLPAQEHPELVGPFLDQLEALYQRPELVEEFQQGGNKQILDAYTAIYEPYRSRICQRDEQPSPYFPLMDQVLTHFKMLANTVREFAFPSKQTLYGTPSTLEERDQVKAEVADRLGRELRYQWQVQDHRRFKHTYPLEASDSDGCSYFFSTEEVDARCFGIDRVLAYLDAAEDKALPHQKAGIQAEKAYFDSRRQVYRQGKTCFDLWWQLQNDPANTDLRGTLGREYKDLHAAVEAARFPKDKLDDQMFQNLDKLVNPVVMLDMTFPNSL